MTNKVVVTVARALTECGVAAVRFNFRGVGASAGTYDEGRGETDDALAVLRYARVRWPGSPLWLGGFSFGSYVSLRVQAQPEAGLAGLITVAPPVGRWDFAPLQSPRCPWLIVHGSRDELVPLSALQDWNAALPRPGRLVVIDDAEHFFHGRLALLREAVGSFWRSVQR